MNSHMKKWIHTLTLTHLNTRNTDTSVFGLSTPSTTMEDHSHVLTPGDGKVVTGGDKVMYLKSEDGPLNDDLRHVVSAYGLRTANEYSGKNLLPPVQRSNDDIIGIKHLTFTHSGMCE